MTNPALSRAERDALRPVADGWKLDYQLALDDAREKSGYTLDQWIDLAWSKGFVAHLAPENPDPETGAARARMGRVPWRQPSDPVFCWRSLYALEYFRTSMQHSAMAGPAAAACLPLFVTMSKLGRDALAPFFPKLRHHAQWPWMQRVCELLVIRAQQELRKRGVEPHDPVLRRDSRGTFQGIPVMIESICSDGTLWLQATDFGPQNSNVTALHDLMRDLTPDGRGLCPSLIDASLFTLPKGKER